MYTKLSEKNTTSIFEVRQRRYVSFSEIMGLTHNTTQMHYITPLVIRFCSLTTATCPTNLIFLDLINKEILRQDYY